MSKKKKEIKIWQDFKKFISRGNVVDMAVGVIMGSAFGAIVTAFTNILLSICTWAVPGGLSGLVSILPPITAAQKGYEAIGTEMMYTAEDWVALGAQDNFGAIKDLYVNHGGNMYYKGLAVIDWGALINAAITFLIIALTLFSILKIYSYLKAKRAAFEAKLQEEYYQKHPEERPAPVVPGAPVIPEDILLLREIRDSLKNKDNNSK